MAFYPFADQFAEKLHTYTRPRDVLTGFKNLVGMSAILDLSGEAKTTSLVGVIFLIRSPEVAWSLTWRKSRI